MHLVRKRSHEFGVRGVDPNAVTFDLASAVARKDRIVAGVIQGIYERINKSSGVTFIRGQAEFTSPVDIRIGGRTIQAEKTILAVGARPVTPDIPGLAGAGFLTNFEALERGQLPESMIVVGGGYVGVEFAQMYSRFGTRVTLIGRASRIMPKEEPELSVLLADLLRAEGVEVRTSTEVVGAGRIGGNRYVLARTEKGEEKLEAHEILFATGRTARVEGLGLEQTGVTMRGAYVNFDGQMRTSAPNIWSIGDANGGPMFTHRATYDGPYAALNAVRSAGKEVDYRVVPRAVFTEPTLASVGLGETEARAGGNEIRVGIHRFADSGRAKAMGQTDGLVKLVADAKTGELLGGHILGPHADILIHEVVTAMYKRGNAESIAKSIHIHPTLSEAVKSAARALG